MQIVQLQIRQLLFLLHLILLNAHLGYKLLIFLLNFIMLCLVLILCNGIVSALFRLETSEVSFRCYFIFPTTITGVVDEAGVVAKNILGDLCKHGCILILNDCWSWHRKSLRLHHGCFNLFIRLYRRGNKRFLNQPHFLHQPIRVLKYILFIVIVI